jgi:hypothetical protein
LRSQIWFHPGGELGAEPPKERVMKYGVAWLLGVPVSIIALWFVANQMGCGL